MKKQLVSKSKSFLLPFFVLSVLLSGTYVTYSLFGQAAVQRTDAIVSATKGGGRVVLNCLTASSSSSLDFTSTYITSTYDVYEVVITDLVAATTSTHIDLQVSTDGGSTWDTTSNHYTWHQQTFANGLASNTSNATEIQIVNNTGNPARLNATFRFYTPGNSSSNKPFLGQAYNDTVGWSFDGRYNQTTAFNGLRLKAGSGNLTSGKVCLSGLANL